MSQLQNKSHGSAAAADTELLRGELPDTRFAFARPEVRFGSGAFGTVFKGHFVSDEGVRIPAALKVVKYDGDTDIVWEEISILLDMPAHDNVVKLYGFARRRTTNEVVIVMEELPGGDLLQVQKERPLARTGHCLELAIHAAKGLSHMHDYCGLVHGDIKTRNISCDKKCVSSFSSLMPLLQLKLTHAPPPCYRSGRAKLVDLGLAAAIARTNRDRCFYGTINYAAPELFPDESPATAGKVSTSRFTGRSAEADTWAFGMVLYALFTGREPFESEVNAAWTTKAQKHTIKLTDKFGRMLRNGMLPTLDADLAVASHSEGGEVAPAAFADLVKRCWSRDPKSRPRMSEVVDRLRAMRGQWRRGTPAARVPAAGGGGICLDCASTSGCKCDNSSSSSSGMWALSGGGGGGLSVGSHFAAKSSMSTGERCVAYINGQRVVVECVGSYYS